MRIVLHVGFHKTGTSSLQAALVAHGPDLADFAHVETRRISPGLVTAAEAARAFSVNPDLAALGRGMAAWVAALPALQGKLLLASTEDFAGHMPGRFGLVDYRAALQTVPAAVAALRARFVGARVLVLVTTREAEGWLKSLHWQVAQHPDLMLKQRQFCKALAGAAQFDAVTGPMAQALQGMAEVHSVPLETLTARRLGPVEAVYDLARLPDPIRDRLPVVHARNRRPETGLADQFVALNRAKLPEEELARAKQMMQSLMRDIESA